MSVQHGWTDLGKTASRDGSFTYSNPVDVLIANVVYCWEVAAAEGAIAEDDLQMEQAVAELVAVRDARKP